MLRRPQDSADRSTRTLELLRHLGIETTGVRTASIRALDSSAGQTAVLVSVERSGAVPGSDDPGQSNPLCLLLPDGGACGTTTGLRSGSFLVLAGDHVYGLVPDGIATVELGYPDGRKRSAAVQDNFFTVTDAPVSTRTVPTPAGALAPMEIPIRPDVRWIDDGGNPAGPPIAP